MNHYRLAWKNRATFLGIVADRQNVVERLACELFDAFRTVAGDVDVQFAHDDDGLGSNLTRLGSRAEHLGAVSRVVAQQTFGHLAAG